MPIQVKKKGKDWLKEKDSKSKPPYIRGLSE
jgi:hypothetical protein